MPRLPLELSFGLRTIQVPGIVDIAATVNVLPYSAGVALGAVWEEQLYAGSLAGNLRGIESRALRVSAKIPELAETTDVSLVFAWAETDNMSLLLGQTNFLMEFNVCFYRSNRYFDVWRV